MSQKGLIPKKAVDHVAEEDFNSMGLFPYNDNYYTLQVDHHYFKNEMNYCRMEMEELKQMMEECPEENVKENRREYRLLKNSLEYLKIISKKQTAFTAKAVLVRKYKLVECYEAAGFTVGHHHVYMFNEDVPDFILETQTTSVMPFISEDEMVNLHDLVDPEEPQEDEEPQEEDEDIPRANAGAGGD
jgi:hypothetical protein